MYSRDTVLTRREPFDETDPAAAYNRVRVVGTSPVAYMGGAASTWSGVSAQGVIIEPVSTFAGNLDRPLGELQRDYAIESEPEPTVVTPSIRVINAQTREAGPSPEDAFAETRQAEADSTTVAGRRKKAGT